MSKIIDTAGDCTINQLMKCLFDKKYNVLVINGEFTHDECEEAFKSIYAEFLDLSKLIQSEEFSIMQSMFYIGTRIKRMEILITIERESIEKIGMPFIAAFPTFKRYGYNLFWDKENPDKEAFLKKITSIEMQEKRFNMQLEEKRLELFKIRESKEDKDKSLNEKRIDFIRTLNNVSTKYKIDRDVTTVEEYAIMLCDFNELAQASNNYNKTN
jgi:hypothetical protein